jgi:DNA-binding MarR family transcriptional regulator
MAAADWDEFPNPTLLRSARGVYAQSIRAHLAAIGIDDLPRNGPFVLGGVGYSGGPSQDLPAGLNVSKQAVSQVIEILVNRGYLTRSSDPGDRRRVVLELTGSGREVMAAIERGVDAVDRRLAERVAAGQIEAMRAALIALTEIKADAVTTGAGKRRDPGQLRSFSPIFTVRDLGAALAHYAALGFDARAYDGRDQYGFADRDGVGLHLAAGSGGDRAHPGMAYLYVRDADALYLEWTRPGIGGHNHPVEPTAYGLREGSHADPDGNLIRFGSPAAQ